MSTTLLGGMGDGREGAQADDGSAESKASPAELALAEELAPKVRALYQSLVEQGIDAIGQLLFKELFGSNRPRYAEARGKHPTLAVLLSWCTALRLPMGRTWLADSLQLAAFAPLIEDLTAAFHRLPPSHRIELMRLGDPKKVEAHALVVLEEGRTIKQLRAEVAALRGIVRTKDRRVLGLAAAFLSGSVDKATGKLSLTPEDLAHLTPKTWARAKALARVGMARFQELDALLGAEAPPPKPRAPRASKKGEAANENGVATGGVSALEEDGERAPAASSPATSRRLDGAGPGVSKAKKTKAVAEMPAVGPTDEKEAGGKPRRPRAQASGDSK